MMTSPINSVAFSAFGLTIIPKWHYQDLVSENEIKRDRLDEITNVNTGLRDRFATITDSKKLAEARLYTVNARNQSLEQENKSCEATRTRNLAQIQSLESKVKDTANRTAEVEANSNRQRATIRELQEQVEILALADRTANELIEGLNIHVDALKKNVFAVRKELDSIKATYRKTLATNAELDLKLEDAIADISKSDQRYNELTVQIGLERTANKLAIANHRNEILASLDNLEF